MKYQDVIKEASEQLNIPEDIIKKTYSYFWKYISETIKNLPLKEELSEEEFLNLKTNFNIPSIGKLYCTYDDYRRKKSNYTFKNVKD